MGAIMKILGYIIALAILSAIQSACEAGAAASAII